MSKNDFTPIEARFTLTNAHSPTWHVHVKDGVAGRRECSVCQRPVRKRE